MNSYKLRNPAGPLHKKLIGESVIQFKTVILNKIGESEKFRSGLPVGQLREV